MFFLILFLFLLHDFGGHEYVLQEGLVVLVTVVFMGVFDLPHVV